MKTLHQALLSFFFLMMAATAFSQGKITGILTDAELGSPISGASVSLKGTTTGTTTDFDGKFAVNSDIESGTILISMVGFMTRSIPYSVKDNQTIDLGSIRFSVAQSELDEIIIKSGVADIAKDRKTPVAVSTIKAAEIRDKLGNREFPEILNLTPSVYATKSGGGFGDSRVTIRGFAQENIAVMVNGVPINDMENSRVFWSNWAGLSDVTSAMQVQRGLGSSKLAISSIGGTINVLTKTADIAEGGSVSVSTANDNYIKTLASYSTGKMKNGLSASFLLSQTKGDGYVDGTKFEGGNYFIGIGYDPNSRHSFQFTLTGAPQWHNQRSQAPTIAQYLKYGNGGRPNIKYNTDWGYLDGKEYSFRTNYYHKPVLSVNWDWTINETTKLATVVYGSWGRGGGSNGAGAIRGNRYFSDNLRKPDGSIDVDLIRDYNTGGIVTIGGITQPQRTMVNGAYQSSSSTSNNATNGISQISSINSHNWYGGVINLNKKLGSDFVLDFGVDLRTYRGIHYQNMVDLLGSDNYADNFDINNPNRVLTGEYAARPHLNPFFNSDYQQKINYNNDGLVNWYGAFTQLEYSTEKLTAFIQGAVSNQGFRRDDYFKYLTTDPLYSTDYENILGGNVKGGLNYNIDQNHNVFFNTGYYSKQPFFNAVYPNNASVLNENLTNEKIFGIEAGYGFRSSKFNANLNVYRTSWKDRFIRIAANIDNDDLPATPTIPGSAFLQGVEQIHLGAELDFTYKLLQNLTINGMTSVGNWKYGSNVTANYQDDNNVVITKPSGEIVTQTLYIDGLKVGDAAQTTMSIGATYEIIRGLKIDGNYWHVENLYASIDPVNFRDQAANKLGSLELPGYGLMNVGASYKLLLGKEKNTSLNFRLNIDNVMDKRYIAESRTNQFAATEAEFNTNTGNGAGLNPAANPMYSSYADYTNRGVYDGLDVRNQVYYGFGRTWNFTVRYDF